MAGHPGDEYQRFVHANNVDAVRSGAMASSRVRLVNGIRKQIYVIIQIRGPPEGIVPFDYRHIKTVLHLSRPRSSNCLFSLPVYADHCPL